MHFRPFLAIPLSLLLFASCESAPPAPSTAEATSQQRTSFEDRLWRVTESSAVASGTLYRFRSNGTLEITSPGSPPMTGSWSRSGKGLVMIEDSLRYQADILELTPDSFVIRSHNPGQPVDIRMVPVADAKGSAPD